MTERNNLIHKFLADNGWQNATSMPLAGDASHRKYFRVFVDDATAILMDAPPKKEATEPFVVITQHLHNLGYSAPTIIAQDSENGLVLLEDLGDNTFTIILNSGVDESRLYECAVDLLVDLHKRPLSQSLHPSLPVYDDNLLLYELKLFSDWYLPHILPNEVVQIAREVYISIWLELLPLCQSSPKTLVHRDFHADNLMWLPDRSGLASCGLIDYQDAVAGPSAYDLMSLIEDARRDLRPGLPDQLKKRYLIEFPDLNHEKFMQSFHILAAQRHCKVIGIFFRLAIRDNKNTYLSHIPRVWNHLENACFFAKLNPLREWLDQYIPKTLRNSEIKIK